jgi:bifunctional non-homologous end joining protein LigD
MQTDSQSKIKINASLFFTSGSSDKEYHAQIVEADEPEGFNVIFQYGRRGNALTSGSKTSSPVSFAKAEQIFNKLIAEKTGKGYTTANTGVPFVGTEKAGKVSGFSGQLLNAISENEARELITNNDWAMEEKFDGERRSLRKTGSTIEGINRKGLLVALPEPIIQTAQALFWGDNLIDCEIVGNQLFVFDALMLNGDDLRKLPYVERITLLKNVVFATKYIRTIELAVTTAQKQALYDDVVARKGEGVVFKLKRGLHNSGRPNSGGDWLKFPFRSIATVEVTNINDGKRSVSFGGYGENGELVPLGNVSILPNYEIPAVGALINVDYLYARLGGALFQPVYKGVRNDIDCADSIHKLKYKPEGSEDY